MCIRDRDDVAVPDAWDEGEETTDEVYNTANEGSITGGEEADSLPELISGSEDRGYDFLNTLTNKEDKDFEATAEKEKPKEKKEKKHAVAYPKEKNYIFILYTLILYFTLYSFNTLCFI